MELSNDLHDLIKDTKDYFQNLEKTPLFFTEEESHFFSQEIQILPAKKKSPKKENVKVSPETPPSLKEKQNYFLPSAVKISEEAPDKKIREEKNVRKTFLKPISLNPKENVHEAFLVLEKPLRSEKTFEKLKNIITESAPSYPLVFQIPSDEKARQISNGYIIKRQAAEITILSYKESPQGSLFLKNLALAIDTCFAPAKVVSALEIEQENKWEILLKDENLKLIIACDYSIWELPRLMPYYKEVPNKNEHFLLDTALFLLPDISLYLKDPLLKKSLFAALRKKIPI